MDKVAKKFVFCRALDSKRGSYRQCLSAQLSDRNGKKLDLRFEECGWAQLSSLLLISLASRKCSALVWTAVSPRWCVSLDCGLMLPIKHSNLLKQEDGAIHRL